MKLPITGPYTAKDQCKANAATCFIGRGSQQSSTHKYAMAYGELANKGSYTIDDIVFVSVEGARTSRKPLDKDEISRAAKARVIFHTDNAYNRNRSYNVGERELANYLESLGYRENPAEGFSYWTPPTDTK